MGVDMEGLFSLAGQVAMPGWILLALSPLAGRWRDRVVLLAGIGIPLVLSVGYAILIAMHWQGAPGGFGSLAQVRALFTVDGLLLAGWVHYLAFDLFVGGWVVRDARRAGLPHLAVLPCLPLTLLFGPAGLVLYAALRLGLARDRRLFAPGASA